MTAAHDGGWTLRYSRRAEKDVARLDPPVRRRILNALERFAEDPGSVSGLRKLSGRSESRLRVGDWRVILDIAAGIVREREHLHGERPEGVAEVVEAQALQPGAIERAVEATAELRVVQRVADGIDEDEVVLPREVFAPAQPVEYANDIVDHWHAADSARLRGPEGSVRV